MDAALVAIAGAPGCGTFRARRRPARAVWPACSPTTARRSQETLDRLIELAPQHEPWHDAGRRPVLSPRARNGWPDLFAVTLIRRAEESHRPAAATRDRRPRTVQLRLNPPRRNRSHRRRRRGGRSARQGRPSTAQGAAEIRQAREDALEDALDAGDPAGRGGRRCSPRCRWTWSTACCRESASRLHPLVWKAACRRLFQRASFAWPTIRRPRAQPAGDKFDDRAR